MRRSSGGGLLGTDAGNPEGEEVSEVAVGARTPEHRVLLVRQWDQQVGGSGCCGRFSSTAVDSLCETGEDPYEHVRADMETMGGVYRALRGRYAPDELELTVVDPRNTVWLLPAIWRDARRRGLSRRDALRQLHRGTSPCAVICDGLVVASEPESPDAAVAAVARDLRSRVVGGQS